MKTRNRIIGCLLTAVLLLALAPCVLAEDAGDAYVLRLGAPEEQTVTDAASGNEYSYYRVPISVKNNTDTTAKVAFVSLHLRYDSNLRPADFVYWDKKSGEAVQFPFVSAALSGWDWAADQGNGLSISAVSEIGQELKAGEETVFAYANFQVDDNADSGTYQIGTSWEGETETAVVGFSDGTDITAGNGLDARNMVSLVYNRKDSIRVDASALTDITADTTIEEIQKRLKVYYISAGGKQTSAASKNIKLSADYEGATVYESSDTLHAGQQSLYVQYTKSSRTYTAELLLDVGCGKTVVTFSSDYGTFLYQQFIEPIRGRDYTVVGSSSSTIDLETFYDEACTQPTKETRFGLAPGEYYLRLTVWADEDYDVGSAVLKITVVKCAPDLSEVRYPGVICLTTPVSEVEKDLRNNSSHVEGNFYLAEDTVFQAGTHEYAYTFIADDENYLSATGTVALTVMDDGLDHLEVRGTPDQTDYVWGDSFDPHGLTLTAYYTSGKAEIVTSKALCRKLEVGDSEGVLSYAGVDVRVGGITVGKVIIDVDDYGYQWTGAQDYTYNTKSYLQYETGSYNGVITVSYTGDDLRQAYVGTHTTTAILSPRDPEHYALTGTTTSTCTWTVHPEKQTLATTFDKTVPYLIEPGQSVDLKSLIACASRAPQFTILDGDAKLDGTVLETDGTSGSLIAVRVWLDGVDYNADGVDEFAAASTTLYVKVAASAVDMKNLQVQQQDLRYGQIPSPWIYIINNGKRQRWYGETTITYAPENPDWDVGTYMVTATATIDGVQYTATDTFQIHRINVSSKCFQWVEEDLVYNAELQEMRLAPVQYNGKELLEGRDYTLTRNIALRSGRYTARVDLLGNYSGSISIPFRIDSKDISLCDVQVDTTDAHYEDGLPVTLDVRVFDGERQLKEGSNFRVLYQNNTTAGEATYTIRGVGDYSDSGMKPKTFLIGKKPTDAPETVTGSYKVSQTDRETFAYKVDSIAGAEYSADGINWQDENAFDGFAPGQETYFYARIKETENIAESKAAQSELVTFQQLAN